MFSELVDEIITITGRSDKVEHIASLARGTIRECMNQQYFNRDLTEDQITATADPHIWTRPTNFRIMRTVKYPESAGFVKEKPPGRIQENEDYYYYGGPTYFTFVGVEADEKINVAFYSYAPYFKYKTSASVTREAIYDREAGTWTYLSGGTYISTLGSDALNEAAQNKVGNWLLLDWDHVIKEGTLTKLYQVTDDPRAQKHFAVYKSFMQDILKGEQYDTLGF